MATGKLHVPDQSVLTSEASGHPGDQDSDWMFFRSAHCCQQHEAPTPPGQKAPSCREKEPTCVAGSRRRSATRPHQNLLQHPRWRDRPPAVHSGSTLALAQPALLTVCPRELDKFPFGHCALYKAQASVTPTHGGLLTWPPNIKITRRS